MRKLLLCLALITGGVALGSPATEGTLSGRITDPAGAAVAEVSVRIQHWEADKLHRFAVTEDSLLKTDMDGRYSLNLNPGLYDVFVTFPSFLPVAKRVKVEAGKVTDFSPKLEFDRTTTFVE
jgi:Carboxypeptidase regulatory-like domain